MCSGMGTQTFPLTSGQGSELPAYQTVVPTRVQLAGMNVSQVLTRRPSTKHDLVSSGLPSYSLPSTQRSIRPVSD